ncbi:hypothetical protein MLD38_030896 [Melastoma candidum]|uniref:Uncharacterized protein n=1 Tax=Melastoma candidum TaxID=119954 RepID=A0ACB9MT35_9MYRT|nr:hypothetical protein MLD38_030896 [Melastoma candidum]
MYLLAHRCCRHNLRRLGLRYIHIPRYKHPEPQPPPDPAKPPNPPKKPQTFSFNGFTWEDDYAWMSNLNDKVAMRHLDMVMEQEENYLEAVMWGTEKLQAKLQSEMAPRFSPDLSTPPVKLGPWLYYRRVEEGKQYPVLCRRLVSLQEKFISNEDPSAGFDFITGKRIEQKLIDYNQEAERFGGYAYEELSEVSPNHQYYAYTMYDKENDYFRLSVRNLLSGSLCSKPQAERVSGLAWVKGGKALLYVVTDHKKRPFRLYLSTIGSTEEDVLLLEESDENVYLNIRHTKDYQYVTINTFSPESSKVILINAADPLTGLTPIWEGEGQCHCIVEHQKGFLYLFTDAPKNGKRAETHYLLRSSVDSTSNPRLWESLFVDEDKIAIEDVDFSEQYMALILRESGTLRICSVALPLPVGKGPLHFTEVNSVYMPLPEFVCQISPGPNYDYHSHIMRFTVSSPVMPDAVVDYNLSNGTWKVVHQQNLLRERTRLLYGTYPASVAKRFPSVTEVASVDNPWNELSEFYSCEKFQVPSHDGAMVPLTVVYSRSHKKEDGNPGLLHGHGAYGEILNKRWCSEMKSLLDRGWIIAYADVRGGGGKGWGHSAGGLLVASAINKCPDLFCAAVLKVPFLDPTDTLLNPILPLIAADYDEFGYPDDVDDLGAIQNYSPYNNIPKDASFPAVLVTSSFNSRFGIWEAMKWVSRVRDRTIYNPDRPILLNLTTDIVEENHYLHCKESALETAFLLKVVGS